MPVTHHSIFYRTDALSDVQPTVLKQELQMENKMCANAQRDGRPAEYRWRPLFNSAKFGGRLRLGEEKKKEERKK